MCSYHGGKQNTGLVIAKEISNVMSVIEKHGFSIKGYCEPFCGMLGVFKHIIPLYINHIPTLSYKAGDTNISVIEMWKKAKNGWIPPTTCTEEKYNNLKDSNIESAIKGYVGHQYSFGGQYFSGYAPKYGKTVNSTQASDRVVNIGMIAKKSKITFSAASYDQYSNLKNNIIYCDPPYEKSTCKYYSGKNRNKLKFDYEKFWNWCRKMSKHNIVFVSNYDAPEDFILIFEKSHKISGVSPMGKNKVNKNRVEKLYVIF